MVCEREAIVVVMVMAVDNMVWLRLLCSSPRTRHAAVHVRQTIGGGGRSPGLKSCNSGVGFRRSVGNSYFCSRWMRKAVRRAREVKNGVDIPFQLDLSVPTPHCPVSVPCHKLLLASVLFMTRLRSEATSTATTRSPLEEPSRS